MSEEVRLIDKWGGLWGLHSSMHVGGGGATGLRYWKLEVTLRRGGD